MNFLFQLEMKRPGIFDNIESMPVDFDNPGLNLISLIFFSKLERFSHVDPRHPKVLH